MRKLMGLDEFSKLPEYLREGIKKSIEEGFGIWQKIRGLAASVTPEPLCYDNTTHCNAIQDHIQGRLKTNFANYQDVKVDKFNDDVLGLLYKNDLFVRFNKLTDDFRTRTRLTDSHKKYLNQDPDLPGFPSTATIVFAGYISDVTMSEVKAINVVCWAANGLEWVYNFSSESGTEQTGIEFVPPMEPTPIEIGKTLSTTRISKRNKKRKTESDNQ